MNKKPTSDNSPNTKTIQDQINYTILNSAAPTLAKEWLNHQIFNLSNHPNTKNALIAFNLIGHHFAEKTNDITERKDNNIYNELKAWNLQDLARARLFIEINSTNDLVALLVQIMQMGSTKEICSLLRILQFLPDAKRFIEIAELGVRSSITPVFDAIALNNHYASVYFSDNSWNQMVLKAIFNERPLHKIFGLDQRANIELAYMLSDFAHERWAANRPVPLELWRPIGPFIDERLFPDIAKLLCSSNQKDIYAGLLAFSMSKYPHRQITENHQDIKESIDNGLLTWSTLEKF